MNIFDYIFYRVYRVYLKKDDPARFNSTLYISLIYLFILFPLFSLLLELLRGDDKWVTKSMYIIYCILILFYNVNRYSKNYIKTINTNYKVNSVPNWLFFVILPITMVLGIVFYIWIKKSIVDEYQLQGYIYNNWLK